MDKKNLKSLMGNNMDVFKNIHIDYNNVRPTLPSIPNFNSTTYKTAEEVLEDEENDIEENKRPDFENMKCEMCNSTIENNFSWYYLKDDENLSNSKVLCCFDCLKKYHQLHNDKLNNYEIIEYTRCTAYFKCKELDNLRYKCESHKSLTSQKIFPAALVNFCETAQAGIILSTYKSYEVLKDFSKQSNDQLAETKGILEQFSKEGNKQFKITTTMTILVIILTIINLIPTIYSCFVDKQLDEIKEMKKQLIEVNEKLDKQNNNETNKIYDQFMHRLDILIDNTKSNNNANTVNKK